MKAPSFFILGAPKCGTSTLYEMLRKHPALYLPETKVEPHFFAKDIALHKRHCNFESYLSLFSSAPKDTIIGEASTWYLYSKNAVDKILDFNPDARLIVLLRNPVDMATSMHAFNLIKRNEVEKDFKTAWGLQDERRDGHNLPPHVVDPVFVQYFKACALAGQVEKLIEQVRPAQRLILIYEDFFSNVQSGLDKVCRFLDIPPIHVAEVPRTNAHRAWRNAWLADFLTYPPLPLQSVYAPAKRMANSIGWRPMATLWRYNTSKKPRSSLDPKLRSELDAAFAANNDRLRLLLKHELPGWSVL